MGRTTYTGVPQKLEKTEQEIEEERGCHIQKVIDRLAEYEDADEAGLIAA